ncbi:JAB domain-containing protein [Marinirhabdus gelatinilytica]|uniref:RadC-like JAB domain-containing protein n=1 Tax=Marinirhabdus gelatinilytica TaxID=1703343 RepID=A0A370QLB7_9FLAO|nr:JAB domain-containing protein [Marinirhabdus gelatinilytica]RDK89142.1 RadC-like JAB domain-containing protein [Marinirhabdus gelatinilytica]
MKNKVNEIKISYKGGLKSSMWQKVSNSKDAAQLLFEDWDKDTIALQEIFKVVLLNNSNKVKGVYQISQGGITGTLLDIRILFAVILKSLSVAIILCHNHPSGKLVPSDADKNLTAKIKKASELFDIKLLDHLIFAPDGDYYSFCDNGIL